MTNKVLNKFVSVMWSDLFINIQPIYRYIKYPERDTRKKCSIVFFMVTSRCVFYFLVCSKPTRGLCEAILLFSINYFETKKTTKNTIHWDHNTTKKLFINVLNDVNKTLNIQ